MRICICDDERLTHNVLHELISAQPDGHASHTICDLFSGKELTNRYAHGDRFDLLFLDVQMDGADGLDAAKAVRAADETAIIIFVSSYRQYVFDAFPVGAFHYLLKPVRPEEFADVWQRSVMKYRDLHTELCIRQKNDRYRIPIHRILYLEGRQRHVFFHTADSVFEAVGKASDYAAQLTANGFVQVHYSFYVNLDAIRSIEKDRIILNNGETVWMSVRKRADTLRTFDKYLGHRKW